MLCSRTGVLVPRIVLGRHAAAPTNLVEMPILGPQLSFPGKEVLGRVLCSYAFQVVLMYADIC